MIVYIVIEIISCYFHKKGLFISGKDKQLSFAGQVWMVLAQVVDSNKGGEIMNRVIEINPEKGMVSPYMNHHFVEALLMCKRTQKALDYMFTIGEAC